MQMNYHIIGGFTADKHFIFFLSAFHPPQIQAGEWDEVKLLTLSVDVKQAENSVFNTWIAKQNMRQNVTQNFIRYGNFDRFLMLPK